MSRGIVVDHKENHMRYAISEKNFNPKVHKKVRDLRPGESVYSYQPKRRPQGHTDTPAPTPGAAESAADGSASPGGTQTQESDSSGEKEPTTTAKESGSDAEGTK